MRFLPFGSAVLALALALVTSRGYGQAFSFAPDRQTVVVQGGESLPNGFSGGWNSGQFWPCDLDFDGRDDLIVYDKAARKALTFLARPEAGSFRWVYQPDFEDLLPPLESWLATADFNCDGKRDLFTQTSAGIKVYRNASSVPGQAAFVLEVDGLTSQGFNGQVNIQVNPFGAPAFTDVDNDGDLDILTFDFSGNTVEYHQNQVLQTTGNCAGFQMKRDSCVFGLFATRPTCGQIRLNTGCLGQLPPGGSGPDPRTVPKRTTHIGSQLSALDLDGDGDKDLLVGDLGCPLLNRLTNGGSPSSARITQADTLFPSPAQYVKVNEFPSAYQGDFNFDGKTDLVITPTFFSNYSDGFVNNARVGTHLYLNQSQGTVPEFQLAERDFLQNQGIDLGEEALPAFADVDADGDQDLFVGSLGTRNSAGELQASVVFYRNTGNAQTAEFTLETEDFLGLSTLGRKRLRPLWEDFNSDGALDFGWISSPGAISSNETRLLFLLNQNPAGQPAVFPNLSQAQDFPIGFNLYDCPVFIDIDGDQARDVLVGKYAGRVQYWRQTAPWPNLQYQLVNSNYGSIFRAPFATNPVLALADADQNGQPDLVVGDFTGTLKVYKDFRTQTGNVFPADSLNYYNPFFGQGISHAWGNFVSPALADLNGDGFPELAVGQAGGGLHLMVNRLGPNGNRALRSPESLWTVYPNPAASGEKLQWAGPPVERISILDAMGRPVWSGGGSGGEIALPSGLSAGLYLIRFQSGNTLRTVRFVIKSHE